MAEEQNTEVEAPKGKFSMKLLIIIGGVMAVEAVGMVVFLGMLSPSTSKADKVDAITEPDPSSLTQEIEIVDDRFQNLQSGQVWIWDTSVFVKVKASDVEKVNGILERRKAEIQMGVGQIVARAQHTHLKEPERQTLRDQIRSFLRTIFNPTAEAESLIQDVIIPKCRGVPTGG